MNNKFNYKWANYLSDKLNPLLLTDIVSDSNIVVAVPHHAPRGILRMLCDRNADENAGFLGSYLAQELQCSCIIASRYFFDPNKEEGSDYFRFIESMNPDLVIEVHGHGSRNAAFDIEISSGPYNPEFGKVFAEKLLAETSKVPELAHLTISGDYEKIYFTAQYSKTVTDKRWNTLHIELPRSMRINHDSSLPPQIGFSLMDIITRII
ncbi:MAG: hypothetical protein K9M99_01565 [Candidatus Cloacimonetes bacterium]|nr:hypothetical protein [Candidatus Cloacimonadota bacterium]